ncbi:hypothetical protein [Oceanibium sediminis]|uniref:hypothetical protein n=1 Tax=Oceanibium sediminis TaxID=2026339 RepID=UPI000DD40FB9|nr:hypothetical protein [Oceanibium sediminis]
MKLKLLLLAIVLGACAPVPGGSDASRADQCRDRFQAYDRAAMFEPTFSMGVLQPTVTGAGLANDRTAARNALRQFGCTTTPAEMPVLDGRDLSAFARPVADNAAPPRYVHVATVTSNSSEAALQRAFQGLGYPVRVKGAEGLGRRIFLGPLDTTPAQQNALALARELGFASAYLLPRVP